MTSSSSFHGLSERAQGLIACPRCHGSVSLADATARCGTCGNQIALRDGVVVALDADHRSYFDKVFEVMRLGNREPGTWKLFYQRQAEIVTGMLRSGGVVVDIGCGPDIPYEKGAAFVIGVDASFHSIHANKAVDLQVFASAASLPLKTGCVEAVLCFYSIHHMTGGTIQEHKKIVEAVFTEFGRVLRPRGRLLIFDVSPQWPFAAIQDVSWPIVRRRLGADMDMYFWRATDLEELGRKTFPGGAFSVKRFHGSPFTTFPPIFNVPSLRLPRLFYPFDICLYEWRTAAEAQL